MCADSSGNWFRGEVGTISTRRCRNSSIVIHVTHSWWQQHTIQKRRTSRADVRVTLQTPSGHNTRDSRNSRVDVRVTNSLCSEQVLMQKLQGVRSRFKLDRSHHTRKRRRNLGWTFALQIPCVHNTSTVPRCTKRRVDVRVTNS